MEAFSTFDTGHDLSPRFWHVPDTPYRNDAAAFHPDSPVLPFLAPDLTANIYCQRMYLARIAEELGESGADWRAKAEVSLNSLFRYCYDEEDQFFYDRDRNDELVRVQSDVARVMACEVGDAELFDNIAAVFAEYRQILRQISVYVHGDGRSAVRSVLLLQQLGRAVQFPELDPGAACL